MNYQTSLRLFAFSKAALLYSLEGLSDADLAWEPAPWVCSIGWHACHVGHLRSPLMWFFDPDPDWQNLGAFLPFGYGSNPDEVNGMIPPWRQLVGLIQQDWVLFLQRYGGRCLGN